MTFNITPTAITDGIIYADSVPLTTVEAALGGGSGVQSTDPISVVAGQAVVAKVRLSVNGLVVASNAYVFLQTDLGDDTWVDVAWCRWTGGQGNATFVLCGGGLGQMNNAFGPLRNPSSAPAVQSSGSNVVPLGGRIRFSGFATFTGGSSSLAGVTTSVLSTITYKLQEPR